jgi:hypothetical protein
MKTVFTVIFLIAFLTMCWADVIYVSPGTDQISSAILTAYPDDMLELAAGEYTESTTCQIPIDLTIYGAEDATVTWTVASDTVDIIHAEANLTLKNIIFLGNGDAETECIQNMFGSVTPGEEPTAVKNSIFIDQCQFIRFYRSIWTPDPDVMTDGMAHPLDSLYISNCLFYGGDDFFSYQGVRIEYNQVRVIRVWNSTFWKISGEALKLYGNDQGLDEYFKLIVDHCTWFEMGIWPEPPENGVGVYAKYTSADDSIKNNIFYDCSDFAIKNSGGLFAETYYDYNTADSCGWKPGCSTCQAWHPDIVAYIGPNSQLVDPQFTNPLSGDFRLETGSPAIATALDGTDRGNSTVVWKPGSWDHTPPISIDLPEDAAISGFQLLPNYPNPFNPSTTIAYSLEKAGMVVLTIYDVTGKKVRILINQPMPAGDYSVEWNGLDDLGRSVPSGTYYYTLGCGAFKSTKKMVLVR